MEVRLSSKIISNLLLHLPLNEEGDFCFMGESLIIRKGGGLPGGIKIINSFKTEIIETNKVFEVPKGIINNQISVRIFGGGAGGYVYSGSSATDNRWGGGSGLMNNGIIAVTPGQTIQVNIGNGGLSASAGGTTFFGSYLSANGGNGKDGGSGGGSTYTDRMNDGGNGYQFGGGGGGRAGRGGAGGKWGGGGGGAEFNVHRSGDGGNGGYYGGGGGGSISGGKGGHGGYYGGGGGTGSYFFWKMSFSGAVASSGGGVGGCVNVLNVNEGRSGLAGNGGNGGVGQNKNYANSKPGYAGTNTSAWTNVFNDGNGYFRGGGKAGSNGGTIGNYSGGGGGGGGFGGNGGKGGTPYWSNSYDSEDGRWNNEIVESNSAGGGGGGYGSNGGYGTEAGGGGGGFGGDGGNGGSMGGGGGGGYGKSAKGGDNGGGGGGYYGRGGNDGGGGGGYGDGAEASSKVKRNAGYGAGGAAATSSSSYCFGGKGICIIQYYVREVEFS